MECIENFCRYFYIYRLCQSNLMFAGFIGHILILYKFLLIDSILHPFPTNLLYKGALPHYPEIRPSSPPCNYYYYYIITIHEQYSVLIGREWDFIGTLILCRVPEGFQKAYYQLYFIKLCCVSPSHPLHKFIIDGS